MVPMTREAAMKPFNSMAAKAVIPPRKGKKIWVHGNIKAERHPSNSLMDITPYRCNTLA